MNSWRLTMLLGVRAHGVLWGADLSSPCTGIWAPQPRRPNAEAELWGRALQCSTLQLFCPPYTHFVPIRLSKTLPLPRFWSGSVVGASKLTRSPITNSSLLYCETTSSEIQDVSHNTRGSNTCKQMVVFWVCIWVIISAKHSRTMGLVPYCL